jgi:hypothetical protein
MLQVGNGLRNRGLRDRQLLRRLGHAAALHDGQQYVQVAQADAATDPGVPMLTRRHNFLLIRLVRIRVFPL